MGWESVLKDGVTLLGTGKDIVNALTGGGSQTKPPSTYTPPASAAPVSSGPVLKDSFLLIALLGVALFMSKKR